MGSLVPFHLNPTEGISESKSLLLMECDI